jgi:hypothetical protein
VSIVRKLDNLGEKINQYLEKKVAKKEANQLQKHSRKIARAAKKIVNARVTL